MTAAAGLTTLRFQDATGSFMEFTVEARVNGSRDWDNESGSYVEIRYTKTTSASTPGTGNPDSVTISIRTTAGVNVIQFFPSGTVVNELYDMYGTHNGLSNGSPRSGVVEMSLRVTRTNGIGTYDYETDGSPNTAPTGYTASTVNRGYMRFNTSVTQALSNVAAGGAKNAPFEFGESIFLRTTLGAAPFTSDNFNSQSVTVMVEDSGGTAKRSASTFSASGTFDTTWSGTSTSSGRVNSGFAASSATYTSDVSFPTASLAGGESIGHPWNVPTTLTTDSVAIDPRITVDHHMQHNVAALDPALDQNPKNRLTSDLSFIGCRLTGSRGGGLDGLSVTETLTDADNLLGGPVVNRSFTTATTASEKGWSPTLATWDEQLPSGGWTHTIDVTAGDTTGLEVGATETYTLLAVNPGFVLVSAGGPTVPAVHFKPGGTFQAGVTMINLATGKRVPLTEAKIALLRLADSALGAAQGFGQYLDAAGSWVTLDDPPGDSDLDAVFFHTCTETRANSGIYIKNFNTASGFDTSTWGTYDIFVLGRGTDSTGTPYSNFQQVASLGSANDHGGYALDPIALATAGIMSQR